MDFFILIIKSVGSLLILFLLTNALGKKQINQLNMFDYVIGISIGNVVAEMTVNKEVVFVDGVIVMAVYALIDIFISFITTKSIVLRRLISGTPTILMENGKIIEKGLRKCKLDINEFLEEARTGGYFDISRIEYAVMEANGKISFLLKSKYEPVTMKDMRLKTNYNGLCTNVIIDGKIMINNLKTIKKDKKWLITRLNNLNYRDINNLLLVTIDSDEKLTIFEKNVLPRATGNFE